MSFFSPIWMTTDPKKADRAIKKVNSISQQQQLEEIALHAPLEDVRLAAVSKLTDQNALFAVVTGDSSEKIRSLAVAKIHSQELLGRIAGSDDGKLPRLAALDRITDQRLLERFALEEGREKSYNTNRMIQCAAIRKLQSPELSGKVFLTCTDAFVRLAAMEFITDQTLLNNAADGEEPMEIRIKAAELLGRKELVLALTIKRTAERLKKAPNTRRYANYKAEIKTISEPSLLVDLCENAECFDIRQAALEHLLTLNLAEQELIGIITESKIYSGDKEEILKQVTSDQGILSLLERIAIKTKDNQRLAGLAVYQMKNMPDTLFEIYRLYQDTAKEALSKEAWEYLVRHHGEYLSGHGLNEEAEKTAALLAARDEAARRMLDYFADQFAKHDKL